MSGESVALEDTQGKTFGAGLFDSFRSPPFPTLYPSLKTAVTADVLEAGLLFAIAILTFSFLLILPGVIFRKRLIFFLKVVIGLFILISIFLCNFGQEWEVAEVHGAITQYKATTRKEIKADIGVKIGLRSVNVTLKSHDEGSDTVNFGKYNETINYNERFAWDNAGWVQGRGGFGPFASQINLDFRDAQFRGVPYPILWVAEYFVPDGEGIRWGRYYRQAGYYSHILLWLAFPLYILSTILIMMVRSYGAIFFLFTGMSMLGANLCFGLIRNPTQLQIPFEPDHLIFHWGWCFWLCVITGLLNIILGVAAFVLDFMSPDWLCEFLNIDVTKDYEEFYLSREELENLGIVVPKDSAKPGYSKANGATSRGGDAGASKAYRGFRKRDDLGTMGRFGGKARSVSRYRIVSSNIDHEIEDAGIRDAVQGKGRERPALPNRDARAPVVPTDDYSAIGASRTVGYDNPAMNYDNIAASGGDDTPHDLRGETATRQKDQYDNNELTTPQHFSADGRVKEHLELAPPPPEVGRLDSDVPIYDNTMVCLSPHPRPPSVEEEPSSLEGTQSDYEPVINNNPPLPPRKNRGMVCFNIQEEKIEKEKEEGAEEESNGKLPQGSQVENASEETEEKNDTGALQNGREEYIRLADIKPDIQTSTAL